MILFTRTYKQEKISVFINFGKEQSVNIPEGAKVLMGGSQLKTNDFLIYRLTSLTD
jgi:trehalose-6-phosphate hydrolase